MTRNVEHPADGNPVDETRKSLHRVWFWLRLAAVVAILWWVIERNGREKIVWALLAADPRWTLAGALCCFLSIVLGAYQWNLLLRLQGVPYGFRASFRSYYSGMFLNNFLPGTVGGDALRIWDIRQRERSLGKATASTLVDRLMGFSALSLFSLLALAFEFHQRDLPQDLLARIFQTVVAVSAAFAGALVLLLSRRFSGALHAAIQSLGLERVGAAHAKIQDALMAYKARWRRLGIVFLVACVVQLLRIAVHACCAFALGLWLAPAFFFTFIPLIALTAVLPLNVGGWGVPQGLSAYLYALPGVLYVASPDFDPAAAAAALAFLPTVVGMVVMLGGGFYFVFRPSHHSRNPT
jgi:uncharacterized protein (TIRG00374 family)